MDDKFYNDNEKASKKKQSSNNNNRDDYFFEEKSNYQRQKNYEAIIEEFDREFNSDKSIYGDKKATSKKTKNNSYTATNSFSINNNTNNQPPKPKFQVNIADFGDSNIESSNTATNRANSYQAKSPQQSKKSVTPIKKTNGVKSNVEKKPPVKKVLTAQQRQEKVIKSNMRNKSFVAFFACIASILIVTSSLCTIAIAAINDILVFDADNTYSVAVTVKEDSDFNEVFDLLCDNGLVDQKTISKAFCLFRKYNTVEYEPGVYYLDSSIGIEKMLEIIMCSDSNSADTVSLTFPEGFSIAQIFEKIEKYDVCDAEKLYSNLDIVASEFDFYDNIGSVYGRYQKTEGYLFPDTYDFFVGESPSSVLKKLFTNFENRWEEEYDTQLKKLGMTMDEVIIIASILQREADNTSQMADISSVIHNRLKQSEKFPNIQFNSTTDYIKGLKKYELFTDFYYDIYLETYNTYSAIGLPPGPICNPGLSAIKYALYPADTNYLYFCHAKDGTMYVAETADEHYANTQLIL